MHSIRLATPEDTALITQHRIQMFQDNGFTPACTWEEMAKEFAAWLEPRLRDDSYVGWIVEDSGQPIASGGLWLMDFPPHWTSPVPKRGYLLNFYTVPAARGRGIAKELVELAKKESVRRGVKTVTLHASKFGRPVYEKLGFTANNEMIYREKM
ncbi:MAG: GNAT family N-acetyltransferase [Acidobacteria bacterium]|nr:GNAT family N-acetyltransferase [Acidobacteriota bacterium]